MKKFLISFFILILLLILIIFLGQGIYLPKNANSREVKVFSVRKGEGTKEISINLEREGLIKSGPLFRLYTLLKGVSGRLQAGEYLLSPSMTIPQIAKKLYSGEVIKEKITIIEGWNLNDIGEYFEYRGMFQAEELFELVGFPLIDYSKNPGLPEPKDFSDEFYFLKDKPKNIGLEGYLFPDTYEIQKGENLEEIVRKMLRNFDKKLTPDLRVEIQKQNKSIFEIITMASLIEKEVKTFEDKKLVSGILWKRLKVNMPLQVDGTIAYILGEKNWDFDEMRKEIGLAKRIDSPYNTYKYQGLPLGPICNPGLESILASIYPKDSDYWYYLSTPSGETIFSKSLKEHNYAQSKYFR